MGTSSSKNNDELVDSLVSSNSIKDSLIERVFRLVDRGRFFPAKYLSEAYKDNPFKVSDDAANAEGWTPGRLHISAPSMYAAVLERLDLRPGQSFLNIGSGSGWLNTAAGFLIGSEGVNHGIEIHENLVKYANECRSVTLDKPEIAPFGFAVPIFILGNGLAQKIPESLPRYDRIYCGAAVTSSKCIERLVRMLEITGRLVAPVNGALMCYHRTGEKRYLAMRIMSCQFADLIRPAKQDKSDVLPRIQRPDTLQRLCRNYIRSRIREDLFRNYAPQMRSMCSKDRVDQIVTGPHVVFIHNGEQQGEARVNFLAGPPLQGNFARVRVVIPNPEDPAWLNHEDGDVMFQREEEDNTRVQVHDLRDEEDEDDDDNQQIVQPPPRAPPRRAQLPLANDMVRERIEMDQRVQQFLHAHNRQFGDAFMRPFRDEGPNVIESDDDGEDDEDIIPNLRVIADDEDNEANENEEGASSSDEQEARDAEEDADDDLGRLEEIGGGDNFEGPEQLDENYRRMREHRRVSRQRMQVIRANRRRQRDESDSSDEDVNEEVPEHVIIARRQMRENKRRRMEHQTERQETKDERQMRLQRESIQKFREVFDQRIDDFPIPRHMMCYLKHANGFI